MKRRALVVIAAALLVGTGATPGDVGGCGSQASELDVNAYVEARKTLDCQRCGKCNLASDHCTRACDPKAASDLVVPATCHPLAHDGKVCLHALEAASCSAYESYVADVAPTSPTECDFCHYVEDGGT